MNRHTENIKYIWNYCKEHRGYGDDCLGCDIKRHCVFSKKVTRYDDPAFATKIADRLRRLEAIENEENKKDPFYKYKHNKEKDIE